MRSGKLSFTARGKLIKYGTDKGWHNVPMPSQGEAMHKRYVEIYSDATNRAVMRHVADDSPSYWCDALAPFQRK
jgi:hypothetical protein